MREINFIAGGMMGDFIHALSAVRNICIRENARANIFLTDHAHYGGDKWKHSVDKAYNDLKYLVNSQPYVNRFEICPPVFNAPFINLNEWRIPIVQLFYKKGFYSQSWTEFLSLNYNYEIPFQYKWINVSGLSLENKEYVAIHRSLHRHNESFPWKNVLDNITDKIIFITSSAKEYEEFPFIQSHNIEIRLVETIYEFSEYIKSCKYFIGNQSMPFALACALDVPRMVELDKDAHAFYENEEKYSKNISWYLNNNRKFIAENSPVKL